MHSSIQIFIASILLLQAVDNASSFSCGQVTSIQQRANQSSTRLLAKKPSNISGVGGMFGTPKKLAKSGTVKAPAKKTITKPTSKSTPTKAAAEAAPKAAKGTAKSVFSRPALASDTPWSSILVAFLNPLRNPNSLFLYLLIIVSVLGKLNEK
jgi:hypothetical protein